MKKIMCLFLALLTVLLLCACGKEEQPVPTTQAPCNHNWVAATCSAPKTCSICKATEGKAKEHTWKDATCKTLMTCTVCQTTAGELAKHNYIGGTCAICGIANPEYKILTDGAWIRRMDNGQFEIFIFGKEGTVEILSNAEIGSTGKFWYTEEEFSALVQQAKTEDPENWAKAYADCMVCEVGGAKYVTGKVTKEQVAYQVEWEKVLVVYNGAVAYFEQTNEETLRFEDIEFYWVLRYKEVDTVASYFK